ncbi:MAG: xanthine dehydrogenase family protein subunit M [Syntrophaceae bacterium]|nr:xanthine dehydrogenase family protein subunit M [Syntrophaceae bacterium]
MSKVFMPAQPDELWGILDENPEAVVYAGGTDLLVRLRSRFTKPDCLVCLERLDDLKGVKADDDDIFIGALTTHREMLNDPIIQKDLHILTHALKQLGSPPIRNMGTLGGNIVTASPAGDTLAPLYILNAQLEIGSRNSTRRAPIESFILGPGKVDLAHGEILSRVVVRKVPKFEVHHYEKVGKRNALACSVVSMATLMNVSSNNLISNIRLAWGSVGPTVLRFGDIEHFLVGKPLTVEGLSEAINMIQELVKPIDDIRATACYRREVAGRLLLRLLKYSV